MRLLIDPAGGIAGDMLCAALIGAGADARTVIQAMTRAAGLLGQAKIEIRHTADQSQQLQIQLQSSMPHLEANKGRELLHQLFLELDLADKYRDFGHRAFKILVNAEKKAHEKYRDLFDPLFLAQHHENDHHDHHHHHHHEHDHPLPPSTLLHEAQDILIDIVGVTQAMQMLDLDCEAQLTCSVSAGSGHVRFSHGELPVPAPATRIILDDYKIPWQSGPIATELCTPTGASLLAALQVKLSPDLPPEIANPTRYGQSRGSKILPIPPLKIYLI